MADRPALPPTLETEYVNGVIAIPKHVQAEWDALDVKRVRVTIAGGDSGEHSEIETVMQVQHIEREVAGAMLSAAGVFVGSKFAERVRRLHDTAQL